MADCEHIQHHSLASCPGLTPEEIAYGEKVRSVGFTFAGGRDVFHGDYGTIREQTKEIFDNAKKYGNPPPEYAGPRSKMRSISEIMDDTLSSNPGMADAIRSESEAAERSGATGTGEVTATMSEVA